MLAHGGGLIIIPLVSLFVCQYKPAVLIFGISMNAPISGISAELPVFNILGFCLLSLWAAPSAMAAMAFSLWTTSSVSLG